MVQKDFSLNDRVEAFFLAMAQSWETLIATFVLTIFCVILLLLETLYVVWKFDEASFVKDGIAVDRANLFSTRLGDQLCFFNAWAKLIAKALIKLNQAKWFHPCSFTSPCSGTRTLCSLEACC